MSGYIHSPEGVCDLQVSIGFGMSSGHGCLPVPYLFSVIIFNILSMAVNKDSTILEVLQENPDAGAVFARFGMGCVGCAISRGETVSEAAAAHGIALDELLAALGIEA